MRLQARKPINLRGKTIGGETPLVCVPIVAAREHELESQAKKIAEVCPDIIEWRIDYFNDVCDLAKVKAALEVLRNVIGEIPLTFTFRSSLEGGNKEVEDDIRYEIIEQVINTEEVDVVDIELISGKTNIERIKAAAEKHKIPLILSYHNFEETPSVELMLDKMKKQVSSGADIAKIAVMPKDEEDVLNLLMATLKARKEMPDTPIITMSMGKLGVVTRIAGGMFGSDLTFGACDKTSAPGQIKITELKEAMKAVY